MKAIAIGSLVAGLTLAAACQDAPTLTSPAFDETAGMQRVTVMTQNLYVGTDVDAVIAALMSPDPTDDVPVLIGAVETLQKTDFSARAGAVADAIAKYRPDVVGLQEVSDIYLDLAGMGIPVAALGLPAVVDLKFMPIIKGALAARGLHYALAGQIKNIDAAPFAGIQLVDYDAILVNTDRVTEWISGGQNFTFNLGEIADGVVLKRGFVEVGALIDGRRYWVVSTHLESDLNAETRFPELRQAQAAEIALVLGDSTPAFVMGDLNDDPGSPMYQAFQAAGFHDIWAELHPDDPGYTDAHLLDLSDTTAPFTRRIDFIWARGVGHPTDGLQGQIKRFGMLPSDRVDGPYYKIWASDHAGLVATLQTPPAAGVRP